MDALANMCRKTTSIPVKSEFQERSGDATLPQVEYSASNDSDEESESVCCRETTGPVAEL